MDFTFFTGLPIPSKVVAALIAAFGLAFIFFFLIPAVRLSWRLGKLVDALGQKDLEGPVELGGVFEHKGVLQHLWSEYRETLHEEKSLNPQTGILEVARLRATQPSVAYFTAETIVDTTVRTEFFKHLPGILTGLGIIGTFLGLIWGLQEFSQAPTPGEMSAGLPELVKTVSEAFKVSFFAIALAMLVTAVEKALLVRIYRKAEKLTQAIDEHYKAGVGEEYLSRLVSASEESASQTRILKDALVEDMRNLLTELIDRQIAANTSSHSQLGQQIAQSFGKELKEPLDKIAHAVGQVSQDQGSAVQTLLTDVLASFSAQMEGMFGNQLSGIHEMQQQTTAALQTAVMQLEKMAGAVEGAGKRASEDMAAQMTEAVRKLESRQAVMNQEMRNFVGDIRDLVKGSQSDTSAHLNTILSELSATAGALVGDLSARSQKHVKEMGLQVGAVTGAISEVTAKIGEAIGRLESVTTTSIGLMNSSAETLAIAADDFAKAGSGVSGVLTKTEGLTLQLTQAAGAVGVATRSLDGVLKDYQTTRDAVKQMLESVRGSVEAAKREASLTTDVLQRLEGATGRLATAQKSADEYLGKVTEVLGEAHQAFADNVQRTLGTSSKAFYESLSQATKLLREAIVELEQTLGSIGPRPGPVGRR